MSDVSMEVRVIAKVIEPAMQIPGCYYLQKNDTRIQMKTTHDDTSLSSSRRESRISAAVSKRSRSRRTLTEASLVS